MKNRYPVGQLGEVLTLALDQHEVQTSSQYAIAGVYGFGRGIFAREPIMGTETKYARLNRLQAGMVVLSRLKAFEGALAVIPDEFNGFFLSSEFPTFSIDQNKADTSYIKHLCSWPGLWGELRRGSKGIGARRERVNADKLLATEVPLPDLDEQRRIATKLDYLTARVGRISAARSEMEVAYTRLAESLISTVTANKSSQASIGELLGMNRSEVDIDPDEEFRAIGVRSFGKGIIRYAAVPGRELSKLRYFAFPGRAIVLSNIKAWEGAIALTSDNERDYVASNRFLFYTPTSDDVDLSYVRHYLLSRRGLERIGKASPGAADRNRTLGRKSFEKIQIPLPGVEDQKKVARSLDSATKQLEIRENDAHLKTLRASLLNAAFSGQL